MIRFEELKLVRELAKCGSIHNAARELGMSQPALTKKISRMEDKLGVKVFHRSARGTTLTLYGQHLLKKGKILLDGCTQLKREIELMAGLELAELRIGVGPIIEYLFLPKTMSRLLAKYPHVNFDIRVDNTANLITALRNRDIDVAIGSFHNDNTRDRFFEFRIIEDELVFVVRKEHPVFNNITEGQTASLFSYPMAIPDLPPYFETWFTNKLKKSGQKNSKLQCDNYHIIKNIIHNSNHFTGAPRTVFHKELQDGSFRIFPIDFEPVNWNASILYTEEAQHSPIVRAFQKEITAVSQLPAEKLFN